MMYLTFLLWYFKVLCFSELTIKFIQLKYLKQRFFSLNSRFWAMDFRRWANFLNTFCSTEQLKFLATEISNTFYLCYIVILCCLMPISKLSKKYPNWAKFFKSLCSTEQPELSEKKKRWPKVHSKLPGTFHESRRGCRVGLIRSFGSFYSKYGSFLKQIIDVFNFNTV